jgi:hypothetical protein
MKTINFLFSILLINNSFGFNADSITVEDHACVLVSTDSRGENYIEIESMNEIGYYSLYYSYCYCDKENNIQYYSNDFASIYIKNDIIIYKDEEETIYFKLTK